MNKQKSNKQEAKEPGPCVEPAAGEGNLQNGDKSQKRPEKRRQSLGGFFKGLVGGFAPLLSGLLGRGCGSHLQWAPIGWTFVEEIFVEHLVCARRCAGHRERRLFSPGAHRQVQAWWGRVWSVGRARRQKRGMWREPESEDVAWPWVWEECQRRHVRGNVGSGVSLWRSAGRVVPGSGTPGAEVCWRDSTQLKCSLAGRKNSRMEEGRAGTGALLLNCGQREPGRVSTREIALSLPLGAG